MELGSFFISTQFQTLETGPLTSHWVLPRPRPTRPSETLCKFKASPFWCYRLLSTTGLNGTLSMGGSGWSAMAMRSDERPTSTRPFANEGNGKFFCQSTSSNPLRRAPHSPPTADYLVLVDVCPKKMPLGCPRVTIWHTETLLDFFF